METSNSFDAMERRARQGAQQTLNASGGLFPYNQPEKDIYAGLGKPASAPENTPKPSGMLPSQQSQGGANGQNQRAVASAGPTGSGGATGGGGNAGRVAGVSGSAGRAAGAVNNPEDEFMPGTKAVFNEGGKDIAAAWNQGKYTKAAFTGLRQLATYPVAIADDVVGGAVRGAYGLLRNPAEDAGRALLGMEDRKPEKTTAPQIRMPAAQQPSAAPAPGQGDMTMPGQDPGRQTLREAPPPPPRTEFLAAGSAGFDAASKQMDSGRAYIPEDGQGMLRSSSGITKFNTPVENTQLSPETLRAQYAPTPNRLPPSIATNAGAGDSPKSFTQELIGLRRQAQDSRDQTARRGQDMTLQGQNAAVQATREGNELNYSSSTQNSLRTNQVAMLNAQREQANKNREYESGRKDKALEQTQSADKAWTEHANTMFRTKDDKGNSVPDANKAAAYTQFVDQGIDFMARRLALHKDPAKRAYGERLAREGRAALDASDRAELPVLFGRQQTHAATAGSGPFSSGGAASMDPQDYRITGSDNGLFQERVKTQGNQTIPETNLRYGPDANRLFWNSGQGSTHLLPNKLRGE